MRPIRGISAKTNQSAGFPDARCTRLFSFSSSIKPLFRGGEGRAIAESVVSGPQADEQTRLLLNALGVADVQDYACCLTELPCEHVVCVPVSLPLKLRAWPSPFLLFKVSCTCHHLRPLPRYVEVSLSRTIIRSPFLTEICLLLTTSRQPV